MVLSIKGKIIKYWNFSNQVYRYAKGNIRLIISFIFVSVVAALTDGFGAAMLVPILESVGGEGMFQSIPVLKSISGIFEGMPVETRLQWAAGSVLLIILIRAVLMYSVELLVYSIPFTVDRDLRIKVYDVIVTSQPSFLDRMGAGDLSNYTAEFPGRIALGLRFVAMFISNGLVLVVYGALMLAIAGKMALAVIAFGIVTTMIYKAITKTPMRKSGSKLSRATAKFSQIFYETLHGAKQIRLAGATGVMKDNVKKSVHDLRDAQILNIAAQSASYPFFSTITGVIICIALFYVSGMGDNIDEGTGALLIFLVLMFRILGPLSVLNIARSNIDAHVEAFDKMDEFFEVAKNYKEVDGTIPCEGMPEKIEFKEVSFSYENADEAAVKDLTVGFSKGETVAIVGPSGSGKSTLVGLFSRLYRCSSGKILIDGTDVNDLIGETWWRNISLVSQDVVLSNGSVGDNICFGFVDPLSSDQIVRAAQLSAADEFIQRLPEKYDTQLGDRGARLSGGQKQRIALARAFVRNTGILLLDEATSSLDNLTERAVKDSITSFAKDRLIIVIAHRLSTIRDADRIIVMNEGRLVEEGTHSELMVKSGLYRKMVEQISEDEKGFLNSKEEGRGN